jgi:hypothetical protein
MDKLHVGNPVQFQRVPCPGSHLRLVQHAGHILQNLDPRSTPMADVTVLPVTCDLRVDLVCVCPPLSRINM